MLFSDSYHLLYLRHRYSDFRSVSLQTKIWTNTNWRKEIKVLGFANSFISLCFILNLSVNFHFLNLQSNAELQALSLNLPISKTGSRVFFPFFFCGIVPAWRARRKWLPLSWLAAQLKVRTQLRFSGSHSGDVKKSSFYFVFRQVLDFALFHSILRSLSSLWLANRWFIILSLHVNGLDFWLDWNDFGVCFQLNLFFFFFSLDGYLWIVGCL